MKKKMTFGLIAATVMLSASVYATTPQDDIIILYTNDIHCAIEENMGYAGVAAYAKEMEGIYGKEDVILVDAGDALQGGPIGRLTQGKAIVDIMNQVGYDIFVPGNHEFDYGLPQFLNLTNLLNATVISCNFVNLDTDQPVFAPFVMTKHGNIDVAFVGITTPQSYFKNKNGKYHLNFSKNADGKWLYSNVQRAVNEAINSGADYVVAVSHLGIGETSYPWRSTDVIANTTGIDVMIDGHSHNVMENQLVQNAKGQNVILTQAGSKFDKLGEIIINPDTDTITTRLISEYSPKDLETQIFIDNINSRFEDILNNVVANTDILLATRSPETDVRIIRSQETNLGDMVADAYRTYLDTDIAIINSGGIRASIEPGEITHNDIISVHPFGNWATSVLVNGQTILDALEMGARKLPAENNDLLQVSGLTYTIDENVPSSVVLDDKGRFVEVDGEYRVKDVMVEGKPLELDRKYSVGSVDYLVLNYGSGMSMFKDAIILKDKTLVDNEVLLNYIVDDLKGNISNKYRDINGEGRINIIDLVDPAYKEYTVVEGDSLSSIAYNQLGNGERYNEIYELNKDIINSENLIYPGQVLRLPSKNEVIYEYDIIEDEDVSPNTELNTEIEENEAILESETNENIILLENETLTEDNIILEDETLTENNIIIKNTEIIEDDVIIENEDNSKENSQEVNEDENKDTANKKNIIEYEIIIEEETL
ncbi:hypothetical protein AN640_05400 [Candidatus Epulonipiscium fishelsonii]|uniref:Uncharacterized protein n=1 Tax=Candidatus Epulonipiscium fishelsonii TaxID=77094 RepID=A0ACC8XI00_9FIRM|nr:hypothetical protein AN640_05400 [Epulopiscium sp. SCG-D08WGA-EpuloA1]